MMQRRLQSISGKYTRYFSVSSSLSEKQRKLRSRRSAGRKNKDAFHLENVATLPTSESGVGSKFIPFSDQADAQMVRKKSGSKKTLKDISSRKIEDQNATEGNNRDSLQFLFDSISEIPMKESTLPTTFHDEGKMHPMTESKIGRERSILDAFPLPSLSLIHQNPKSIEKDAYDEYMIILNEAILSLSRLKVSQDMGDWLKREDRIVEYHLPTLEKAINEGVANPDDLEFLDELEKQRHVFLKHLSFDKKDYSSVQLILTKIGYICANRSKSLPLELAWEKVKEAGMYLEADFLSNYLYVLSTYPSVRQSSFDPMESIFDSLNPERKLNHSRNEPMKEVDKVDILEEIAAFYDCLYKPTEQSTTVRIKALVKKGKTKSAEALLECSGIKKLRLRTYQPILKTYLQQEDLISALSLYSRMRSDSDLIIDAETYIQVIASVAENGYFCHESPPIDGIKEYGFRYSSGPKLLDELLTNLAEDVLEISSALAKRLHTAIQKGFHDKRGGENLEEQHQLAPLSEENEPAEADEIIASRVIINKYTGVCRRSGARLRLIKLSELEGQELKSKLLALANKEQKSFLQNWKVKPKMCASDMLESFSLWMDKRKGKPFTSIIDGANVAYYHQNFDDGKFNFHQLQFMVDTLEKMNETPLVILPKKYAQKSFNVNLGRNNRKQFLSQDEWGILNKLFHSGKLYLVPFNSLDDLYWMLASISDQVYSRKGVSLDVSVDDPNGRWPGTRPTLITNDQMKDHKLELIEPRLFRRWYASHIVNFNFTGFVHNERVDDKVLFSSADFFSREIQSNSLEKKMPENHARKIWHFPVSDWKNHERFCLRI